MCVREDVGRHNAMDKVVGWALHQGVAPLWPRVLTSLAVRLAADRNMTLCGFARDGGVNVYTGGERVR